MEMAFVEEDYYEEVWTEMWTYKNTVHQMPRGHSKTEMVGIWTTLYIADYQPENPYYRKYRNSRKKVQQQLLLAGAAADLQAWADRLKEFFYQSPPLRKLLPRGTSKDRSSNRWNNMTLMLNNGHKIHLRTMKSRIRGLHVDRVAADDLITESSTLTDNQTINIWDGAVDGTTTAKEAMVNVTGTPLRYTDIQYHLKNKPEGYFFIARPAIIDEATKKVLAPNRRNYADLMRTKKRIGTTKFQAEYMLNPIDDAVSLIKREHVLGCYDQYLEGLWLDVKTRRVGKIWTATIDKLNTIDFKRGDWDAIYITVDFAFSDRKTADHFVATYYGMRHGKRYRLGYIRKKGWSSGQQMAALEEMHEYLNATMHGYEENSIRSITKDLAGYKMPVKLFWMSGSDAAHKKKGDPEYAKKRHTIGKIPSIERLDAAYENQLFVIPYKTEADKHYADLEMEECISWATEEGKLIEVGRHPDIPITGILMNEMMSRTAGGIQMAEIGYSPGPLTEEEGEERNIVDGPAIWKPDE